MPSKLSGTSSKSPNVDLAAVLREVLQSWPLYKEDDLVQTQATSTGQVLMYCDRYHQKNKTPATADIALPNLLYLQLSANGKSLYLLFIQIAKDERGKGHGDQLYKLVIEFARRIGCERVKQLASGGYGTQDRDQYLIKRGWKVNGPELYWEITAD